MKNCYFKCLLCGEKIQMMDLAEHKESQHFSQKHYGMFWPLSVENIQNQFLYKIPIYESPIFADALGVRKVYIRDEGQNFSGSMKDYSVARAIQLGLERKFKKFTVVSSGNHAVSLARYVEKNGCQAIVFVPASSSKLSLLASLPNVYVVGVKNAIFEDVYELVANIQMEEIYNVNVSNELILSGFLPVAREISELEPIPNFILSGVGNGTYLAGIIWGFDKLHLDHIMPKIIPVGMKGAFPTETAFMRDEMIQEYKRFLVKENLINIAEGSIAIASYSMPQLIYSLSISNGFPLGGLINEDIKKAYLLLMKDKNLLNKGAIPEPTGIMGLAAALKYKDVFQSLDVLLIAFTGHGVKDQDGIKRIVPEIADKLLEEAVKNRPDLIIQNSGLTKSSVLLVEKSILYKDLSAKIKSLFK